MTARKGRRGHRKALARNALALVGRQNSARRAMVARRHRIGNSLTRAKFNDLLLVREPQLANEKRPTTRRDD